jgi:phosphoribosylformylglycinamidine cyclo-ligase
MAVTYRQAGVNIDEGNSLVERIKPLARATRTPFVLEDVGGFAGLCGLPSGLKEPVLVSGTDGVGTKLKVAFALNRHDTIGQDLVAMCVNDVITTGADPLFFLDYFGCGKLSADTAAEVVRGIADGCKLAGCALLGGETAELPGMYAEGEYDLAGFTVGVAERAKLLGPARVRSNDVLVGVASSGLHSNGYSLARRVIEQELGLALDQPHPALGTTVGEALLTPTKIYTSAVRALRSALGEDLHALCHVTGGGVPENLPRVLPDGVVARVDGARPWSPLFRLIAEGGPVELAEMRRTFNLGVGLIAVVAHERAADAIAALQSAGEDAWRLGELEAAGSLADKPHVRYVNDPEEAGR